MLTLGPFSFVSFAAVVLVPPATVPVMLFDATRNCQQPYRDRCKTQASHTFLQSLGKRRIHRITMEMADPALPLFFHNKWKGPEKDRWHFAPLLPPVMT
jgi:hypothetical protein